MASFSASFLERIQYNTKPLGVDIALQNLKKLNPRLDDTNPLTMAILASNEVIPEQDREAFKTALRVLAEREQKMYLDYIRKYDDIHRDENSVSDVAECEHKEE
jgi:hypothetical protein